MDLTIKLAIVGGIVWTIAIIIEWLWHSRHDHKETAIEGHEVETPSLESSDFSDADAVKEKVG